MFGLFVKDNFEANKVMGEEGKVSTPGTMKVLGAKWKEASASVKEGYEAQTAEARTEYAKQKEELSKYKKPNSSGYTVFVKEEWVTATNAGETDLATVSKAIGAKWKALSKAEQEKYQKASAKAFKKWMDSKGVELNQRVFKELSEKDQEKWGKKAAKGIVPGVEPAAEA